MSERIHVLAQQLLGKSSVEACSLQEIQDLVNRYPYFAPAQFLLLEKLKLENDSQYTAQLQKAVLYYHNPIAFEYFISSDKFYTEENFEFSTKEIVKEDFVKEAIEVNSNIPVEENRAEDNSIPDENIEAGLDAMPFTTDPGNSGEVSSIGKSEVSATEQQPAQPEVSFENVSTQPADGPVFEPYHTVDYFASQGIKISQEAAPQDKFGRQLKSFTEWLRSMKRIPVNENTPDPSSEQKVHHLAEDSVHQADVVTEAMAEVWLKQGNYQKALEIYQQLSLINPSKNAYFAALIEKLKQS